MNVEWQTNLRWRAAVATTTKRFQGSGGEKDDDEYDAIVSSQATHQERKMLIMRPTHTEMKTRATHSLFPPFAFSSSSADPPPVFHILFNKAQQNFKIDISNFNFLCLEVRSSTFSFFVHFLLSTGCNRQMHHCWRYYCSGCNQAAAAGEIDRERGREGKGKKGDVYREAAKVELRRRLSSLSAAFRKRGQYRCREQGRRGSADGTMSTAGCLWWE